MDEKNNEVKAVKVKKTKSTSKKVSAEVNKTAEKQSVKINDGKCCRCTFRNDEKMCACKKSKKFGLYVARKGGCGCFKYEN